MICVFPRVCLLRGKALARLHNVAKMIDTQINHQIQILHYNSIMLADVKVSYF